MSHIVNIDVQIKDLDALEKAAKKLGLTLRRGQTQYRWWGRSVGDYKIPEGFSKEELGTCDHALAVDGSPLFADQGNHVYSHGAPYEIGVVKRKDGQGYSLMFDFFGVPGQTIASLAGQKCGKLVQEYSAEVVRRKAMMGGFITRTETLGDGSIKLVMTKF